MGKVVSIDMARQWRQAREPGQCAAVQYSTQDGLSGLITRQVRREADHREHVRRKIAADEALQTVKVNGEAVRVLDVSPSGVRVHGAANLHIGQTVAIELGCDEMREARLVWFRRGEAGLTF